MIERLARALMHVVLRGRIKATDDSGPVLRAQVDWGPRGPGGSAGIKDALAVLGVYGLASRPPAETDAVILCLGGEPTDGVVIATGAKAGRLLNLLVGEAALVNQVRATRLLMTDDGVADLNCDLVVQGVSFSALVAAYNAHGHTGVQPGGGVSGETNEPVEPG